MQNNTIPIQPTVIYIQAEKWNSPSILIWKCKNIDWIIKKKRKEKKQKARQGGNTSARHSTLIQWSKNKTAPSPNTLRFNESTEPTFFSTTTHPIPLRLKLGKLYPTSFSECTHRGLIFPGSQENRAGRQAREARHPWKSPLQGPGAGSCPTSLGAHLDSGSQQS